MTSNNSKAVALAANKPLPSAYYDGLGLVTRSGRNKQNPVFQKLEQEIGRYVSYMKSRSQPEYQKPHEESFSRPSDVLFELWNKYEPLLPTLYFQQKVIEMGDFLVGLKEYKLADFQCFSRYLDMFGDVHVDDVTDVGVFKSTYFPFGFDAANSGYTFRALMGKSICMFQVVKLGDAKMQNVETVDACIRILNFLRLVMQVVLPKDKLCWLVYNGTIHMYSVCRHLMKYGHSSKVIEYLLWAAMCMETSVVLLGKKYLVWRTTLYSAICQCYYDCMVGDKAEAFARRALLKINELSGLESMSYAQPNLQTEAIFRHATIKMAIMVFKRSAFESRKKPKGFLRPKTRSNLKDAQFLPWPRTATEKLLVDMFEGSSAQFLCIIEALTDTNKRTLVTQPPAAESEVEMLDVYAELFMAAQEIICGGGGSAVAQGGSNIPNRTVGLIDMPGVCFEKNLMEMASAAKNGVPVSAVVKLLKSAYCYEHWDVFDSLINSTQALIKKGDEPSKKVFEKELQLLCSMQKVNSSYRRKNELESIEKEKEKEKEREKHERRNQNESSENSASTKKRVPNVPAVIDAASTIQGKVKQGDKENIEDLIEIAKVLHSFTTSLAVESVDVDMVVDATLYLWGKCKGIFQKHQTGSLENWRYIQKMEQAGKWVYILENVHVILGWCGLSSVDPSLSAEVALRLSLVLESAAACKQSVANRSGSADSEKEEYDGSYPPSKTDSHFHSKQDISQQAAGAHQGISSLLDQPIRDLLITARNILELGLSNVSSAREVVTLSDGMSIADTSWSKELNPELFDKETVQLSDTSAKDSLSQLPVPSPIASTTWNTIKDLHMELFFMYHRVCLKLLSVPPDPVPISQKTFKRSTCSKMTNTEPLMTGSTSFTADYQELVSDCHKNNLVKAMLLMQRALSLGSGVEKQQSALLTQVKDLILRTQNEDKRLYVDNSVSSEKTSKPTKVPPPPILLSRTDSTMVLKPAAFTPLSGEKVAWYCLFGRHASGSNVRVRLNDYHIKGCGDKTPASSRCIFRIPNLTTHKHYIFAICAYTADGKLIGDSIGETSKPILASHPLPVQMAWAYLAQVAYQVSQFEIAKTACRILWEHFVSAVGKPYTQTYLTSAQDDFKLTAYRLNKRVLDTSSPVLLRMFLTSIFIAGDIAIKEKQLYCDRLCDQGSLYRRQIERLKECERLVVALELAGWLNEANTALQAAIQCYGLLAPPLYWRLPSVPVIQILLRCHVVLQEIPSSLRTRRTQRINESLHHMTACITYHLTKTLRTWAQKTLASKLNDAGRKMLSTESIAGDEGIERLQEDSNNQDDDAGLSLAALKKKQNKKQAKASKDDEPSGNSELRALEAHMLKLSKQAQGEHELTGNEDPSVLHAYISYLPSRIAFREVQKFKRRNRYLEFLVQVVQKAITEGYSDHAIDWCEDALNWISKRNELVLGSKAIISKQLGAVAVQGDDPRKFAAAMVEYNRQKELGVSPTARGPTKANNRKRNKMKLLAIPAHFTAEQRAVEEERQIGAIEKLALFVPDLFKAKIRKKRFRRICVDEMPWRAQLNIVLGLSHFGVFLNKLEMKEKLIGNKHTVAYSTAFLDPEWFTFETAGTLIVGMDGGPARQTKSNAGDRSLGRNAFTNGKRGDTSLTFSSGLERAAAAATGLVPQPLFPVPPEKPDSPRTPRTPEIVAVEERKGSPDTTILSAQITQDSLEKTFNYFRRAIVLSHRGQHWTLLQNAVRVLWNCVHTALIRAYTTDPAAKTGLLTNSTLRSLVLVPLSMACDHWLDMMFHLQSQEEAKARRDGRNSFNFFGNVEDEKGGASMRFEPKMDDHTVADLQFTRRLILRTMEVLFYEKKWEKLIDIALRFTSLTGSRYAEQVYPMVILAQRFLSDRIISCGEIIPQLHFIRAVQEYGPVTADVYSKELQLQVPVEMVNGEEKVVVHSLDYKAERDPMATSLLKVCNVVDAFYSLILLVMFIKSLVADNSLAKKLACVPLDYNASLAHYRVQLEKCGYNARALKHSRRLLILYLGGQQKASLDSPPTGSLEPAIDFVPHTAQPQPSVPVDLRNVLFSSIEEVQTATLPKPQLTCVISSYEKTIEILLAHNQTSLAAQAMHELGNLQYHNGSLRSAYKWWCEAVDLILGQKDAVSRWRELFFEVTDISSKLLKRCGLWGCLLGSVITSNISQYILTSDLSMRSTCCFLSAYFFKALFRASLPHPSADRDYASYDIGEGFEVTSLVPGIDLLSDHFRADGRSVVAALRWVSEELARGKYNLFVLPLLTLYQYFTTYVCRDLQRAVDGRILKARVLTDLGLFSEALTTLVRLLHGDRLPHIGDSNFRQVESKMPAIQFDNSKPLEDASNLKIVELVVEKRLSTSLSSLYGPHLTCQLSLVQARLIIALADTISALPAYNIRSQREGAYELLREKTMATLGHGGAQGPDVTRIPPLSARSSSVGKSPTVSRNESFRMFSAVGSLAENALDGDGGPKRRQVSKFTDENGTFSRDNVMAVLINTGEKMLTALHDILTESAEQEGGLHLLKPSELELVTQCKLMLADVARQRHHAGIAVNYAFSAMKLLKSSQVFVTKKKSRSEQTSNPQWRDVSAHSSMKGGRSSQKREVKITDQQNNQFAYQNFQSRSRLDARLWLECRHSLINNMLHKVSGMGLIKGKITKVSIEMKDCKEYIEEGIHESEVCGDSAMLAQFLMLKVKFNHLEGVNMVETLPLLQSVLEVLRSISRMSVNDLRLFSQATVLLTDMTSLSCQHDKQQLSLLSDKYLLAHKSLLSQMELLGDVIVHYHKQEDICAEMLSTPANPMSNLYLPQVPLLAQVKMRLGHTLALRAAASADADEQLFFYTNALSLLTTALHINNVSTGMQPHVKAEIYLALGRIQHQLYLISKYDYHEAVSTLLQAILTSRAYNHDLGLIRQAYLEIAMIYLHTSEHAHVVSSTQDLLNSDNPTSEREDSFSIADDNLSLSSATTVQSSSKSIKTRRKQQASSKDRSYRRKVKGVVVSEPDKEKLAAYVAIKCAAQAASCQLALAQIVGDHASTKEPLQQAAWVNLPQFMALDLVGDYVIGKQRHVYKDWVEEQMAPLVESMEPKKLRTYEDVLCDAQEEAIDLNWIHCLGYQSILHRMVSHSSLTLIRDNDEGTQSQGCCVRYTLDSLMFAQRIAASHAFFSEHLSFYSENCVAISPPRLLDLSANSADPQIINPPIQIISCDYLANMSAETSSEIISLPPLSDGGNLPSKGALSVTSNTDSESTVGMAGEPELTFQWYIPLLQLNGSSQLSQFVHLIYSGVRKDPADKKMFKSFAGQLRLQTEEIVQLHKSLVHLVQKGEIALVDPSLPPMTKKPATVASTPAPTKSSRVKAKGKPISPKLKKDEAIEATLRGCMNNIYKLFGLEWPTLQEILLANAEQEQAASAGAAAVDKPSTPKLEKEKSVLEKGNTEMNAEEVKIPFEMTRGSFKLLERMFNLTYGHTLTHSKLLTWLQPVIHEQLEK
ncbi:cilia- and flagella-associated protein 54-like [Watersipora subatra]|uniref:cilia- and flagella-associated protein 54-like n=1 Tax=Watersipora subatra TaxID=2589382 RepID=UPI00355ADDED